MMDELKPYPKYKDSGLPWMGSIPQHWECLPHRAIFQEIKEHGHVNEPLLSVTISKGIIRQEDLLANSSKKDSSNLDKSKYKFVEPGDIAYNKMRAWQGAVGASRYRGIVSPAYIVQRLRGGQRPEYFHYLFRTPIFAKEAERWSYGITSDQWSLRPQHFKMIYSCVPPLDEQELIVGFLRNFDRQVRGFIRNRRRLIEVLNEQKQAIINRAVTRGLDPNVPLKPSGVDWLGEIPEHWEVVPLKYLFRYAKGRRAAELTKEYIGTCPGEYPVYSGQTQNGGMLGKINWFEFDLDIPAIFVTTVGAKAMTTRLLEGKFSLSQNCALIISRNENVDPYFYEYQMQILFANERHKISLIMQPSLRFEDLDRFKLACPPQNEQKKIIAYLEKILEPLKDAIERIQREIDLIREYRTRLIADVVTGKVDVRHLAPPPGDEDLEEMAEALEPLDGEPGDLDEELMDEEVTHADD